MKGFLPQSLFAPWQAFTFKDIDSLALFLLVLIPIGILPLYPTEELALFISRASILGYLCIKFTQSLRWTGHTSSWTSETRSRFLWIGWSFLSLFWSISPYTSRYVFLDFFLYISIYSLIRQSHFPERMMKILCQFLVIIAVLISVDGFFQKFYRYPTYFSYLAEQPEGFDPYTLQITKDWITALSGRVFSRFLLPSHLAGYLIMIIPLNMALIQLTPILWKRICWILALGVNLTILFFTESYGAWLSLLTAFALVLFYPSGKSRANSVPTGQAPLISGCRQPGESSLLNSDKKQSFWQGWNLPRTEQRNGFLKTFRGFIFFSVGIFIVLTLIGYSRGIYLWNLNTPNHPGYLRLLNWKSAFFILMDYPWTGTGLGTFKIAYPPYMLPNSNEANFVHNSYLQIGAELGFPGLLAVCYVTIAWILKGLTRLNSRTNRKDRILYLSLFVAGLGFCLHNLVDYDLYVPALGLPGFLMLGLSYQMGERGDRRMGEPENRRNGETEISDSQALPCLMAVLLIGLLGLSLWLFTLNGRLYLTNHYIHQIKEIMMERGDSEKAYQIVQKALFYDSRNPLLYEISGTLLLQLKQPEGAAQAFQKAIELDPKVPRLHAYLGEAYLFKGDLAGAYVETKKATELFPLQISYQKKLEEISSLLEKYSVKKQ